jgi:hypothetical protein
MSPTSGNRSRGTASDPARGELGLGHSLHEKALAVYVRILGEDHVL